MTLALVYSTLEMGYQWRISNSRLCISWFLSSKKYTVFVGHSKIPKQVFQSSKYFYFFFASRSSSRKAMVDKLGRLIGWFITQTVIHPVVCPSSLLIGGHLPSLLVCTSAYPDTHTHGDTRTHIHAHAHTGCTVYRMALFEAPLSAFSLQCGAGGSLGRGDIKAVNECIFPF